MSDTMICNAVIENVSLSISDHGVLTGWIDLNYGGAGQSFGGFGLYLPKDFKHHEIKSFAGHFIFRCIEIGGVEKWEHLKGKTIRVEKEGMLDPIKGIGHIVKEDWFYPEKDFGTGD